MKKRIYFHPGAIALLVLIPVVFTAITFSVFEHTTKTLLTSIIVDVFLWLICFWNIILCSGSVEADLDGQIFLVKRNIRSKEVQIKLSEIEKIYITIAAYNTRSEVVYKVNSKDGAIIGTGYHVLNYLLKSGLDIPVDFESVYINLLFSVKLLLQKGQLTRIKAKQLKEYFHIPQKYFDKWYNEPKQ
ncbi:MAG: hypothetical protein IJY49_02555 [Clostridia bacterium]|nr:hypothetical protein [Clostridia bacterium]